MTSNKNISIEVFSDFLPNNAVINWSTQYDRIAAQPNFNYKGEVAPSIQSLQLTSGWYSILVVYRDSYTEQVDISLEVEFTALE